MIAFFARLHRFRPSRPRNPLLRIGFALLGVALLLVLLVGGVFVGLGMLAVSAVRRLVRSRKAAAAPSAVIEAEYRVVAPRAASPRAISQSR